ncbi:TolC family protein [Fontisphaera persica]|uniref:TolC family protein n=1 Tax=Fontisphaera persica TaxID=2974023 RepID=UPI0024BF1DBF|nr:TolC family protein [Fontisphaera persica]WCJ57858.1 TolC family protein [Fontisphaera persica]
MTNTLPTLKQAAVLAAVWGGLLLLSPVHGLAQEQSPTFRPITLLECIQTALLKNHALQIQRLNPAIARNTLRGSYGYYDPWFTADVRRESLSDSGGFDPADFSKDAVYRADSTTARLALTGVLPTGARYTLGGDYANSYGTRNFMDFDSYNLNADLTLQQPLLKNFWIDQGRMTIQINKHNLKITELGVRYLANDVINQVQLAYYELLYAREYLGIQQGLVAMRHRLLAGVNRQIEVGMLTPPDAQLAQSQLAVAQAECVSASNLVVLAENALKTILGEAHDQAPARRLLPQEQLITVPEAFDLHESWTRALRLRADLAQLRLDLKKAEVDLKYRHNQLFPSLDLVAGYGRRGASTVQTWPGYPAAASASEAFSQIGRGDNPSIRVGVIFSLPLGRTMERGSYQASKHLKMQAALLVKQKEQVVMQEVSDALHTAQADWDRLQVMREAVKSAENALAAEERRLAGGKSTLFVVLQLQRDLATVQTTEARARANYNQAVSRWRWAEGSLLESHRIALDLR